MEKMNTTNSKAGQYGAVLVAVTTLVTFAFAMAAIPPSGPNCPGNCMEYPFAALLEYYPRDYLWMYLAVPQLVSFLFLAVALHSNTAPEKRLFSLSGLVFSSISATVLLLAYWVQFAVVPISAVKGETEGLALLTQYNGHGVFIAMEELGYVTMSIALFFFFLAFDSRGRLQKAIRAFLGLPLVLTTISFVAYTAVYGIDRHYRFEVAAIAINWTVLIVLGGLFAIHFKRHGKNTAQQVRASQRDSE
jgi:hypothetical protein